MVFVKVKMQWEKNRSHRGDKESKAGAWSEIPGVLLAGHGVDRHSPRYPRAVGLMGGRRHFLLIDICTGHFF